MPDIEMDEDEIQEQVEEVLADVDERGGKDKMSKENWRDFLWYVIGELSTRHEAVREELGE